MKRLLAAVFVTALVTPIALLAQAGRPVVSRSGDIYVATRNQENAPGGVVALRDTNGDGRADVRETFGDSGGTGIQIYNGYVYMSRDVSRRSRIE